MMIPTYVTHDSSPSVADMVSILYIKENKQKPFVQWNFVNQLN